jgi:PKD repeat protein
MVEDINGCRDTAEVVVQSNSSLPQAAFSATATGLQAAFTSSGGNAIAWQWFLGDGTVSTQQNPAHTYATAGAYTVCLVVSNGCGSDTLCQLLSITCPEPVAGFSFGVNNLSVTFTNQSTQATSWYWEFGNGYHGATANPTHVYGAPGTYTVCQIVTNDCGSDTLCSQVTVSCPDPVAGFTTSINELAVNFSQASSLATSLVWDFGDGTTSSAANPIHTYPAPGTYTACLVVFNECGLDTLCETFTLTCALPTAGFTTVLEQFTASFLNTSTGATGWVWDFGDGSTAGWQHPRHTYAADGDYTVCQIAFTDCGADTFCQVD